MERHPGFDIGIEVSGIILYVTAGEVSVEEEEHAASSAVVVCGEKCVQEVDAFALEDCDAGIALEALDGAGVVVGFEFEREEAFEAVQGGIGEGSAVTDACFHEDGEASDELGGDRPLCEAAHRFYFRGLLQMWQVLLEATSTRSVTRIAMPISATAIVCSGLMTSSVQGTLLILWVWNGRGYVDAEGDFSTGRCGIGGFWIVHVGAAWAIIPATLDCPH